MKVEFTPLTASLIPACRAFNERLRSHAEPPFLLPEKASAKTSDLAPGGISSRHYVAVDQSGEVRGGVFLTEQPGWLQKQTIPLVNIQSPLSEGLVDRKFSGVGLQMLKFVTGRSPYAYAVGMGSDKNPLPRLLQAAGWWVKPVPFEFAVISASRFLSEIGPVHAGNRKWLATAGAAFGLASVALRAWRLAHPSPPLQHYSLELATSWPNGTDAIWERCRADLSFSLVRDERTLAHLYPDTQRRLKRFVLHSAGEIVGWSVALVTRMEHNSYFGDLVVGTILDGLATKEHLRPLLALTQNAIRDLGAEVILTNQTHSQWQAESRKLGFFSRSSNYLLAVSTQVADALRSEAGALDRMHVNRGDGDGRIHL
jgi:hypothetical protein